MTCWEWVILIVVLGLVGTMSAVVTISAYMTSKIRLEQARRGR